VGFLENVDDMIKKELQSAKKVQGFLCPIHNGDSTCSCNLFPPENYEQFLKKQVNKKGKAFSDVQYLVEKYSKELSNLARLLQKLEDVFFDFMPIKILERITDLLLRYDNSDNELFSYDNETPEYISNLIIALVSYLKQDYSRSIQILLNINDLELPKEEDLKIPWLAWETILRSRLKLFVNTNSLTEAIRAFEEYGADSDEFQVLYHALMEWSFSLDCRFVVEYFLKKADEKEFPILCTNTIETLLNIASVSMKPLGNRLYNSLIEHVGKRLSYGRNVSEEWNRCRAAFKLLKFTQETLTTSISWEEFFKWHNILLSTLGRLDFPIQLAYRTYFAVVTCQMGNKIPAKYLVSDLERLFLNLNDLVPYYNETKPAWFTNQKIRGEQLQFTKSLYGWHICDSIIQIANACHDKRLLSSLDEMILWLPSKIQSRLFKKIATTKIRIDDEDLDLKEILNITESVLLARGDISFTSLDVAELLSSALVAVLEKDITLSRQRNGNNEKINEMREFIPLALDQIFSILIEFIQKGDISPSQVQIVIESILTKIFHIIFRGTPFSSSLPPFIIPS